MRLVVQILLYFPLLYGYWLVHSRLALWAQWLPDLFSSRPLQLSGLLAASALCGLFAGIAFAVPVALLYRQYALLVATTISLFGAAFDFYLMSVPSSRPFTLAVLAIDLLVFAAALPIVVFVLLRLRPNNSFKPNPLRGSA
ncbi:conserved membrane hypothetical protein [Luteimonas sp. 9C]|uniref:hypothetical protein n=1 Tax=Luteimonas sp. 9C TaxID=2653148 RepID=UPI0012F07AD1|nr:hypothetical protein [Luteimonas sp. 9C]VXC05911.1 conserved membrane hypothetical protein [Luteimonas sp. 9C]